MKEKKALARQINQLQRIYDPAALVPLVLDEPAKGLIYFSIFDNLEQIPLLEVLLTAYKEAFSEDQPVTLVLCFENQLLQNSVPMTLLENCDARAEIVILQNLNSYLPNLFALGDVFIGLFNSSQRYLYQALLMNKQVLCLHSLTLSLTDQEAFLIPTLADLPGGLKAVLNGPKKPGQRERLIQQALLSLKEPHVSQKEMAYLKRLCEQGETIQAAELSLEWIKQERIFSVEHLLEIGQLLFQVKKYTLAFRILNQVVEVFPSSLAWDLMAQVSVYHGQWEQALNCFHKALDLDPGNSTILKNRERCLRKQDVAQQTPTLFLNGLGNSASEYIANLLSKGLGFPRTSVAAGISDINYNVIVRKHLADHNRGHVIKEHLPPLKPNLFLISKLLGKMVVHVRDPRGTLISECRFLTEFYQKSVGDADFSANFYKDYPPEDPSELSTEAFLALSAPQQYDYYMRPNGSYQLYLKTLEGWLDASQNTLMPIEILFTRYEDFKANEAAFIAQILDFYQIPASEFEYPFSEMEMKGGAFGPTPDPTSPNYMFRKGDPNEWRRELSPSQIQKATQLIPERLFQTFGWPRV